MLAVSRSDSDPKHPPLDRGTDKVSSDRTGMSHYFLDAHADRYVEDGNRPSYASWAEPTEQSGALCQQHRHLAGLSAGSPATCQLL